MHSGPTYNHLNLCVIIVPVSLSWAWAFNLIIPDCGIRQDNWPARDFALLRQQLPVKKIGGISVAQRSVGLGDSAGVAVTAYRMFVIVLGPA